MSMLYLFSLTRVKYFALMIVYLTSHVEKSQVGIKTLSLDHKSIEFYQRTWTQVIGGSPVLLSRFMLSSNIW
jgi:hypothetical protein